MTDSRSVAPRVYRFSVFELDVRSGELRKAGTRLNRPDQPLQVLIALLERRGELVPRDELQHRLWPGDTFVDFEHGLNAAVKRLREVLGDSAETPRFIETVPRRGYRFIAPVDGTEPAPAPARRPSSRWWWGPAAALAGIIAALGAWRLRPGPVAASPDAPMRVVQLTSMKGVEDAPTFSPDGTMMAFAHGQFGFEDALAFFEGNTGVYIAAVGSGESRRLSPDHSQDKAADYWPSWSPDGQHIAFVRAFPPQPFVEATPGVIYVMSPLGTDIVKVSDFPVAPFYGPYPASVSWSPDSNFILAVRRETSPAGSDGGIYLIPLDGTSPRQLTTAKSPAIQSSPVFSPRGDRVAYLSCAVFLINCGLDTVNVSANMETIGAPRRVTGVPLLSTSVAWGRDGRSLIFDSLATTDKHYLWTVDADGQRPPDRLDIAGNRAIRLSVSPHGARLAFVRADARNRDIYRLGPGRDSTPVVASSVNEYGGAISPDGSLVAFESARSAEREDIWLARIDGMGERQLTHGPNHWQGSPTWSPDGRRIAFDSQGPDGRWHVWVIDIAGGVPRQLTRAAGDQNTPSWSFDGNFVYYSAAADLQHRDMWRVRVDSGREQQLTHIASNSGTGYEVAHGKYVQYNGATDNAVLLFPLAGGPPRKLADCFRDFGFRLGASESYYVDCSERNPALHAVDPDTGRDRTLGPLPGYSGGPVSISMDGKVSVYTHDPYFESDIMLIENFK